MIQARCWTLLLSGFALCLCQMKAPVDISETGGYVATGFMGDGERGRAHVRVQLSECQIGSENARCYKIGYSPGSSGWAGLYWQSSADNWGAAPGKRILGASRVTFLARGERGGEMVEFKAGGIDAPKLRYRDSFEASLGEVRLTKEWKRYEIPLKGQDLSNVIGAFAWVATADGNPGGLAFYLSKITYE